MQDIVKEEVLSNTVCCIVHPTFSRKLDLLEYMGSIASRNRQDRYFLVTDESGDRLSSVFGFAVKSTGEHFVHILMVAVRDFLINHIRSLQTAMQCY